MQKYLDLNLHNDRNYPFSGFWLGYQVLNIFQLKCGINSGLVIWLWNLERCTQQYANFCKSKPSKNSAYFLAKYHLEYQIMAKSNQKVDIPYVGKIMTKQTTSLQTLCSFFQFNYQPEVTSTVLNCCLRCSENSGE